MLRLVEHIGALDLTAYIANDIGAKGPDHPGIGMLVRDRVWGFEAKDTGGLKTGYGASKPRIPAV